MFHSFWRFSWEGSLAGSWRTFWWGPHSTNLVVTAGCGGTSSQAPSEHGSLRGVRIAKVSIPGKRQKLHHLFRPHLGSHATSFPLHLSVAVTSPCTFKGKGHRLCSSLDGESKNIWTCFKSSPCDIKGSLDSRSPFIFFPLSLCSTYSVLGTMP